MNQKITNNFENISIAIANEMLETTIQNPKAKFVIATGSSPVLAYAKYIEMVKKDNVDVSNIQLIKLDEWLDVDLNDSCTCETFIQNHLMKPLGLRDDQLISFPTDSAIAKEAIEQISLELGTVDISILGFGMNGHIGLNEPTERMIECAHITDLDEKTKTHSMIKDFTVKQGITFGFKELLNSKKVILIITGANKQDAYNSFVKEGISTNLPATLLKLHTNLSTYVDTDTIEV